MTGAQRSRHRRNRRPGAGQALQAYALAAVDERLEEPLPGCHGVVIPADAYVKIADEDGEQWDAAATLRGPVLSNSAALRVASTACLTVGLQRGGGAGLEMLPRDHASADAERTSRDLLDLHPGSRAARLAEPLAFDRRVGDQFDHARLLRSIELSFVNLHRDEWHRFLFLSLGRVRARTRPFIRRSRTFALNLCSTVLKHSF